MSHQELPLPNLQALSPALEQLVGDELTQNETLLWLDQPIPKLFTKKTTSGFLFGIPWTAFSVFWMFGALQGSIWFGLFGLPFVLIGLGMLSSPWWSKRNVQYTVYVITDKRAITFEKVWRSKKIISYGSAQLQNLQREQGNDGSGTLILQQNIVRDDNDENHQIYEDPLKSIKNI